MPYLTTLDASNNQITDIAFFSLENQLSFLATVNLSKNKIEHLGEIAIRNLRILNLNMNQIAFFEGFRGHPTLEVLELRGNKINSLVGFANLFNLKKLYLADNQLPGITGLSGCPLLEVLHLRSNPIESLSELPSLPSLSYLNLRQTQIGGASSLTALSSYKSLRVLNLLETPLLEEVVQIKKESLLSMTYLSSHLLTFSKSR